MATLTFAKEYSILLPMQLKLLITVFVSVFIAETADKTQFATLLFSMQNPRSKWLIFVSASMALITATLISVLIGSMISKYLSEKMISIISEILFILIGIWILTKG